MNKKQLFLLVICTLIVVILTGCNSMKEKYIENKMLESQVDDEVCNITDDIADKIKLESNFEEIEKIVKEQVIFETGYAFLMDKECRILVHPVYNDNEFLGDVNDIFNDNIDNIIDANDKYIMMYTYQKEQKYTIFKNISNEYILGVVATHDEVLKVLKEQ